MSQVTNALNQASSPNYTLDQIVKGTKPAKQPGAFRRVLGSVVGTVGNVLTPGLGGIIGNAISGNLGANQTGLMDESMQFLQLQQQMNQEQRAFETASSVLKARHDAAMAAIRNIQ